MPKVSIVLPTYNGAQYLRKSVESIIGQTFQDWELIIVDDCSTDDTPELVEIFATIDSRVHVIHNNSNQKLPKSLNIGFGAAQGEYLTWTSDDNMYLPEALEQMKAYLDANPNVKMVRAPIATIDEMGNILSPELEYNFDMLPLVNQIGACFMYRRSVLTEIGQYNEELFGVEDYDYWLRVYEKYSFIGNLRKVLYHYRVHAQSLTATKHKMVLRRLYDFRQRHWAFIFDKLRMKPALLTRLYYEMENIEALSQVVKQAFYEYAPWLKKECSITKNQKYIIYGAGDFGQRVFNKVKEHTFCFADSNPQKQKTKLMGKDVISLEKAVVLYPKAVIIIAGDTPIVFSMIQAVDQYKDTKYIYCTRFGEL